MEDLAFYNQGYKALCLLITILACVVMNRLLSRGPLGIGSVPVCVVCVVCCVACGVCVCLPICLSVYLSMSLCVPSCVCPRVVQKLWGRWRGTEGAEATGAGAGDRGGGSYGDGGGGPRVRKLRGRGTEGAEATGTLVIDSHPHVQVWL